MDTYIQDGVKDIRAYVLATTEVAGTDLYFCTPWVADATTTDELLVEQLSVDGYQIISATQVASNSDLSLVEPQD